MKSRLSGALCVWLVIVSPGIKAATIATGYTIKTLGFTDIEHTRNDGYRSNNGSFLNEAGQVAGTAGRYNGGTTDLGQTAWLYNGTSTINVGLVGAGHTRDDGYRYSNASYLNEAGQVAGSAKLYSGSTDLGRTTWLYNGTSTADIGLAGTEYARNDGYRDSFAHDLNEAGQVAGGAVRYNGMATNQGRTAWLYNGTGTVNIGLVDAEHTRSDGFQESFGSRLNEAGQVAGGSQRYNNTMTNLGRTTWLYNGTSTVSIGFVDAEHTRSDGYRYNFVRDLNEAGKVAGTAERYNGGATDLGQTAWLYNGTGMVNIGLVDAEHTRNDGYRYSSVSVNGLNEAGNVLGTTKRYNSSSTDLGKTAWLYNGTSSINIGLVDAEHTRDDGYRSSGASRLNEAGQVAGTANRYNGTATNLGSTAWLYNGTDTVNIGLVDAEHTRDDGGIINSVDYINETGQVAGGAIRYNGTATFLGITAWLYNGTDTINLGLTDTAYTRNDGYRVSGVSNLNDVGQVAGSAQRYNGGAALLGDTAWLYDITLDQTFELNLSVRSDGYASSNIQYLGEDGLALGSYNLYDANDSFLGSRAFAFSFDDGLFDLGSLIDGGLGSTDWDLLASAFDANNPGQILGTGLLSDMPGGQMAYLLTPATVVPVPAAVWLFCSGLLGLIGMARRKKSA